MDSTVLAIAPVIIPRVPARLNVGQPHWTETKYTIMGKQTWGSCSPNVDLLLDHCRGKCACIAPTLGERLVFLEGVHSQHQTVQGLECAVGLLCTRTIPWSYSIRVGHCHDFWLPSVAILPWFYRTRCKAMYSLTSANMRHGANVGFKLD